MVEVASNKCPACSAKVRANAVFCYHCGCPLTAPGAAAVQTAPPQDLAIETADEQTFVEPTFVERTKTEPPLAMRENGKEKSQLLHESIAPQPIRTEISTTIVESNVQATELPPPAAPEAIVAPPANRKTKRYVSQPEYVWEPGEAPAWRIILFALLALVGVAILIWISSTLK